MKRLTVVFAVLFIFSISAEAQTGGGLGPEQKGQMGPGMMGGEGKMPMMPMCKEMMKQRGEGQQMCPMCMQMMKQHKGMMQMMMNMMQMQQKMMKGMKPAGKKEMMMEMDAMMHKMEEMMGSMGMMGMMGKGMRPNIKCAEEWLKKAIDLHEIHIKDPKTATEASQMEMMDQMNKAYECIVGTGAEKAVTPPQKSESGEKKKKDEHGH